ncbi:hypothetical protein A9K55_005549 [Cordyceps militaris]|uniref:Uncharacterized protein n=1 Tax=Cordyceps militaris TaxID=73501 RepID=A0A2H4SCX6_CORMI|nr:hypothetical protein A9K55_005549 [Cordyceps militaris]
MKSGLTDPSPKKAATHTVAGPLGAVVRHDLIPDQRTSIAEPNEILDKITHTATEPLLARLPFEIREFIGEYLVRFYCTAATQLLPLGEPGSMSISISSCIWAQYIKVHGRTYLSRLSNRPEKKRGVVSVLIHCPGKPASNVIYVASDPWGIRKVLFTPDAAQVSAEARENIWWEAIPLELVSDTLITTSDGLKLRTIKCPKSLVRALTRLPARQLKVWMPKDMLPRIQMDPLRINDARTTGYYTSLAGDTVAIWAHQSGCGASLPMSRRKAAVHLFTPMNAGEWVSQIWARFRLETPITTSALIFIMNTGQVHVMGEHPYQFSERDYWYKWLMTLENEPATLHLDLTDGLQGIGTCNVARPKCTVKVAVETLLPRPRSSHPAAASDELFYYSRARLENVVQVRLCREENFIIGIMLCYQDGACACLGRVVPGQIDHWQSVDGCGIWFLMEQVDDYPQVVRVEFSAPRWDARKYLFVGWRGELEWWSGIRQCELHYHSPLH